jgi:membrane protein DedA with SNARE-associated domain
LEAIEEQLVLLVQELFNAVGWPGVILAMAIESACIPLPSEVTMPLSGWMLVKEAGLPAIATFWGGLWGAVGCVIGSVVAYWVGAWGGRPFLLKYGRYVLLSKHDIDLADRWFDRYGELTTFLSRLLPVVRTFISLPAGIARMNFPKFVFYTFIGSLPWCWGLTWAGYVFGEHWREVREAMRPFDIPIAIICVGLVAWFLYRRIKSIRSTESQVE